MYEANTIASKIVDHARFSNLWMDEARILGKYTIDAKWPDRPGKQVNFSVELSEGGKLYLGESVSHFRQCVNIKKMDVQIAGLRGPVGDGVKLAGDSNGITTLNGEIVRINFAGRLGMGRTPQGDTVVVLDQNSAVPASDEFVAALEKTILRLAWMHGIG
jgi:hypothetical protein